MMMSISDDIGHRQYPVVSCLYSIYFLHTWASTVRYRQVRIYLKVPNDNSSCMTGHSIAHVGRDTSKYTPTHFVLVLKFLIVLGASMSLSFGMYMKTWFTSI